MESALNHRQTIEKVIYMHVISIIAKNKSHAHHKTHLYTVKVYNTRDHRNFAN